MAREALDHGALTVNSIGHQKDSVTLLKAEIFGLAALMLRNMQESAERGYLTHGDSSWKAFAKALWLEHEQREMKT